MTEGVRDLINKGIRERLCWARETIGLTQVAWTAAIVDAGFPISLSSVRNYEPGAEDRSPKIDYVIQVARVFGIRVEWVLYGTEPWRGEMVESSKIVETGEIEEVVDPDAQGRLAFYEALWGAQMDAPRVIKADETFQGPGQWKYAGELTYMRILVPILLDWGLVYEIADVGPPDDQELDTKSGGIQWMTTLEVAFRLTHAPSGFSQVYRIRGRRTNDTDKGVSHSIASAGKTFLQRLLNVGDMEEAPPNPVQESQRSRKPKHGGRQPRKPQRQAQEPPGSNGIKSDPPPPQAEGTNLTDAERLEMAQAEVKALLRKHHQRIYHLEALSHVVPDLPELVEEWGLPDFELVQKILTMDPDQPERAMKNLAVKNPTTDDRKENLHNLQRKLIEQGKAMSSEEQVLTAAAMHSNWSEAVEYWIDQLHNRLSGQQELNT